MHFQVEKCVSRLSKLVKENVILFRIAMVLASWACYNESACHGQKVQARAMRACRLYLNHRQELSYRKQIARQLRTQYVEGIYRSNYPVTLKYRLRVT